MANQCVNVNNRRTQLCEYEKEAKRRHPAYQGTLLRISEALSFLFQSTDDNHWMSTLCKSHSFPHPKKQRALTIHNSG